MTLKELRIFEIASKLDCFNDNTDLVLEAFECRNLGQVGQLDAVNPLIKKVAPTLKTLVLGRESNAYQAYIGSGNRNTQAADFRGVMSNFDIGEGVKLDLHTLGLLGLRADPPSLGKLLSTIVMNSLRSLTLESCEGWDDLLLHLSNANKCAKEEEKIRLSKFCLRSEGTTPKALQELSTFLSSFTGLRELSVLLDHVDTMPDVDCFLPNHASSLKALVWAGRAGIRGIPWNIQTSTSDSLKSKRSSVNVPSKP